MPVIPDPSEFPSASQKDPSKKPSGEQREKPSLVDYLSKGPHIPDDMPSKASKKEMEARKEELNKPKN
ncbi:hypothetical protein N7462_001057 [Penicillium macrosclerotiorum]|uniref:uncharacterized protein n=1 Tax=Penicillium macrosclerotiorum TaxID=303699 RepID=UPI0025481247|nr:uncharacterized protein N7462_001057 [Penicillium macrosclerotiorum]KAJ5699052.1 hypothetical protein N7462_001057 [Penicillium macrosclerotiorum]